MKSYHLNLLYVLIGKYRIFLMKYLGLIRVELLEEFSKRLNVLKGRSSL